MYGHTDTVHILNFIAHFYSFYFILFHILPWTFFFDWFVIWVSKLWYVDAYHLWRSGDVLLSSFIYYSTSFYSTLCSTLLKCPLLHSLLYTTLMSSTPLSAPHDTTLLSFTLLYTLLYCPLHYSTLYSPGDRTMAGWIAHLYNEELRPDSRYKSYMDSIWWRSRSSKSFQISDYVDSWIMYCHVSSIDY